jgi:VanZ family protein
MQLFQREGFVFNQLPLLLWAFFIFVTSSIPSLTLPEFKLVSSDKLAHMAVYFILTALLFRALSRQGRFPRLKAGSLKWSVVLSVAYGASDEFHQSFVPMREVSVADVAADAIGAILFALVVIIIRRLKGRAS